MPEEWGRQQTLPAGPVGALHSRALCLLLCRMWKSPWCPQTIAGQWKNVTAEQNSWMMMKQRNSHCSFPRMCLLEWSYTGKDLESSGFIALEKKKKCLGNFGEFFVFCEFGFFNVKSKSYRFPEIVHTERLQNIGNTWEMLVIRRKFLWSIWTILSQNRYFPQLLLTQYNLQRMTH